jgi:hypothetical protein
MRITIKTPKRIKSDDIKALYLLVYALDNLSSEKMKVANLQYVADRLGYALIKRGSK